MKIMKNKILKKIFTASLIIIVALSFRQVLASDQEGGGDQSPSPGITITGVMDNNPYGMGNNTTYPQQPPNSPTFYYEYNTWSYNTQPGDGALEMEIDASIDGGPQYYNNVPFSSGIHTGSLVVPYSTPGAHSMVLTLKIFQDPPTDCEPGDFSDRCQGHLVTSYTSGSSTFYMGSPDTGDPRAKIYVDSSACLTTSWNTQPNDRSGNNSNNGDPIFVYPDSNGTSYTLNVTSPLSGVIVTSSKGPGASMILSPTDSPAPEDTGTFYITCNSQPDLTATLGSIPSTVTSGQSITWPATVTNSGSGSAGASTTTVQMKYGSQGAGSYNGYPGSLNDDRSTGTIAANDSTSPASSIGGYSIRTKYDFVYSVRACADSGSAVSETNENNNCSGWQDVTVTGDPNANCSDPGVICAGPDTMSGTLTPSYATCTIASGDSACLTTLAWHTYNPVATSAVTSPGSPDINGNDSAGTLVVATYDPKMYYLYNNAQQLAQSTAKGNCVSGTEWNRTKCAVPVPAPSGWIRCNGQDTVCGIDRGASATITWLSNNTTSCAVTSSPTGTNWSGTQNSTGNSTGALTSNKTYILDCTGTDSSQYQTSVDVAINGTYCANGATNYPTCTTTGSTPERCVNGATNPPTCTTNPTSCINGANNPPDCTTTVGDPQNPTNPVCLNGAKNPPTCTIQPKKPVYIEH